METIKRVLISLTKEEFYILLNSLNVYKLYLVNLNYTTVIDRYNSIVDELFYNMISKADDIVEINFIYCEEDILDLYNALTIYKKVLKLINEKTLTTVVNTIISKLKNI